MRTKQSPLPLLPLLVFCLSVYAHAQPWSGIIDTSRAMDWSTAGVTGGIPNRTIICSALNPGATAAQINSSIASCPGGQVVFLNAGTYNLSGGIDFANHSNVTLRGAGADQTFLVFNGNTACAGLNADVCIRNGEISIPLSPSHTANWTAGYAKGATQITLDRTTNIIPGETVLVLDQLNDASDPGAIYVCETIGVCSQEGISGSGRANRQQLQLVLATAVIGNTVTISPGLYMPNWRSGQNPGAWWSNTVVAMDGIEDVSLDHTNSMGTSGVVFDTAYNCWIKNVRGINTARNHIWLYQTAHTTVRDSYFYGTRNAASTSYGIEAYMSSDNLVENNIFQHISSPIQVNGASSGSVYGYNFSIDDFYNVTSGWMTQGNSLHSAGVDSLLFEGNSANGLIGDDVHGTHHFITAFRNQYLGWEPGKSAQTTPVMLNFGSRYFNIIGNVLGKLGYHAHYQAAAPDGTNANTSIYVLGWSGNQGITGSFPNDPLVLTTLMRWGNYDVVNDMVRWDSSEVPSGLSQYANSVPSSHNLPASFYLSSKPRWWGSMPWPASGPDVTGGSDTSGHAYAIPAQVCYNSSPIDSNYGSNSVLLFNASACFPSSTPTLLAVPSSQILVTSSGLAYSRVTQRFTGAITITNAGGSALAGPFAIAVIALTSGVSLGNATGDYAGYPYLTVPGVYSLAVGQSAIVNVQFSNPLNAKIDFTPVVFSGSLQ